MLIGESGDQKLTWVQESAREYRLRTRSGEGAVGILQIENTHRAEAVTSDQHWIFDGEEYRAGVRITVKLATDKAATSVCTVSRSFSPDGTLTLPGGGRVNLRGNALRTLWVWRDVRGDELVRTRFLWRIFNFSRGSVVVTAEGKTVKEWPMLVMLGWFLFVSYFEDSDGA